MIHWYHGECREVLQTLPEQSVHCVVTSPPYWGLRDYGVHEAGGIGLEPTFAEWLANMVEVMRAVWRVLRDDGTLWLNMGDAYAGSWGAQSRPNGNDIGSTLAGGSMLSARQIEAHPRGTQTGSLKRTPGLKAKDLIGQPWRLALALQDDGWYLRSEIIEEVELYCPCGCGYVMEERIWRHSQDRDIIWHKPNPMPESVQDRPTKSHEYLFLLTKQPRYFYDAEAVREESIKGDAGAGQRNYRGQDGRQSCGQTEDTRISGRNKRTVWTIPTQPYSAAHFASFPPALVEPCIQAGTSARGCCAACGAPWRRVVERETTGPLGARYDPGLPNGTVYQSDATTLRGITSQTTTGWTPTCPCNAGTPNVHAPYPPVPCTVLDPFGGAGTTALVADRLGRAAISIELNAGYLALAQERVQADAPLFHGWATVREVEGRG